MSGLMDKVKDVASNKEQKDGQAGNSFEQSADNAVNKEVNDYAGQAGVPQGADKTIDAAVDKEVNNDIPGGN